MLQYNLVSTEHWKARRITSLNGSTGKLHFARRSLFQATIQLLKMYWIKKTPVISFFPLPHSSPTQFNADFIQPFSTISQ